MEDESVNEAPDGSEVFTTTDGKKVRLEYDRVFSYVGKTKSNTTTIEYGYGDNREKFILDIDFDNFDAKLTQYKKDIRDYWRSQRTECSPY